MELEKLKEIQEKLREAISITPCNFTKGNVLGVDSAYLLDREEIISSAIIYNTEREEVIERAFSKKNFFSLYPRFSLLQRDRCYP